MCLASFPRRRRGGLNRPRRVGRGFIAPSTTSSSPKRLRWCRRRRARTRVRRGRRAHAGIRRGALTNQPCRRAMSRPQLRVDRTPAAEQDVAPTESRCPGLVDAECPRPTRKRMLEPGARPEPEPRALHAADLRDAVVEPRESRARVAEDPLRTRPYAAALAPRVVLAPRAADRQAAAAAGDRPERARIEPPRIRQATARACAGERIAV